MRPTSAIASSVQNGLGEAIGRPGMPTVMPPWP